MQTTNETRDDKSAYKVSDMPGGVDLEIQRLRDQALLFWEREARNLEWFGLRDGMSVLEVGSGPGFVTGRLLDMLPNSAITAIDIDPLMIERARAYLGNRGGDRLHLI